MLKLDNPRFSIHYFLLSVYFFEKGCCGALRNSPDFINLSLSLDHHFVYASPFGLKTKDLIFFYEIYRDSIFLNGDFLFGK